MQKVIFIKHKDLTPFARPPLRHRMPRSSVEIISTYQYPLFISLHVGKKMYLQIGWLALHIITRRIVGIYCRN